MSPNTFVSPASIEAEAVLQLDDEPGRLTEIERRLTTGVPAPAEWSAYVMVTFTPATSTVPPLFIPIAASVAARQPTAKPQAHLVDARPCRPQPRRECDGVADVVVVSVGDEHQVAFW